MVVCIGLFGIQPFTQTHAQSDPPETLEAFASETDLQAFLEHFFAKQDRENRRRATAETMNFSADVAAPAAAPAAERAADESITNVQHAGVDEGGIIKVHGDHLVILRRGRLFTVNIGDDSLTPISAVDAYAPGISARGTWYDEMLISDNIIIVIGYSYERGGTEVGLFEINSEGGINHSSTYHLRSNDYYSSRNYSSRLVDGKLIFYTPLGLWSYQLRTGGINDLLPAMRRWNTDGRQGEFEPIASATQIFRPARELEPSQWIALHTVTTCDISSGEMDCDATAVLGPAGHTFYVSPNSVYVWVSGTTRGSRPNQATTGMAYRLPLDGSRPSALGVMGTPIDQFSFLESDDEHLNVLVSSRGGGQWMWHAEGPQGELALLRVPLNAFGNGRHDAATDAYTPLPAAPGWSLRNRFVGDYLLYGASAGYWNSRPVDSDLQVVEWRNGNRSSVPLAHSVERIEIMGAGAVVVGTMGSDLHFSSVQLDRSSSSVVDRYRLRRAAQGESRSHGFFYRPDTADSGVLGLPVQSPGSSSHWGRSEGSASIVFLRNQGLNLTDLGELDAQSTGSVNDHCVASCVDWYGNARPIFLRGRIFALLGYEIAEGRETNGQISEVQRTNFTPEVPVVRR